MVRSMNKLIFAVAVCAVAIASSQTYAGTIIKLTLGDDDMTDIEFTGGVGGILSTVDDLDPSIGDQNTAVEFLDVLDPHAADIVTAIASVTLDGVVADGNAIVFGGTVVFQNFMGGTLSLYDSADNLLLSGTLDASSLIGTLGPPATGGLITTTFGAFTGGSLAGYLDPNSLALSISLADINGGAGLSVTPGLPFPPPTIFDGGELNAFMADASIIISADPIPEPSSIALLLTSGAIAAIGGRRRQQRRSWIRKNSADVGQAVPDVESTPSTAIASGIA